MKGTKINLAFGTEVIYEDADFYIDTHDKVGIVGEKGAANKQTGGRAERDL